MIRLTWWQGPVGDSPVQTLERQCHPAGPQTSPSGGGAGGVSGEHDSGWEEDHLWWERMGHHKIRSLPQISRLFLSVKLHLCTWECNGQSSSKCFSAGWLHVEAGRIKPVVRTSPALFSNPLVITLHPLPSCRS